MFDDIFSRLDTIQYTNVTDRRTTAKTALTHGVARLKKLLHTNYYTRLWRHGKANTAELSAELEYGIVYTDKTRQLVSTYRPSLAEKILSNAKGARAH